MKYQEVSCEFCKKVFKKNSSEVKRSKKHFCSKECCNQYLKESHQNYLKQVTCDQCGKQFDKRISEMKKSKSNFCSRSCSVTYTNKHFQKRHFTKKCKTCETKILSSRSYCKSCFKNIKFTDPSLPVKIFYYDKHNSNRYTKIRSQAQTVTSQRPQKCENCGYDKHVETSHKKAIKDFDPETPIGIVNHPDNLILLCPNCHWEYDHQIRQDGIAPPTFDL